MTQSTFAKNTFRNVVGVAAAVLLVAITVSMVVPQPVVRGAVADPQALAERSGPGPDDLLAQVETEFPGFGGMFVDEASNTLYVYSSAAAPASGTAAAARRALRGLVGPDLAQARIRVIPGRYGFKQLVEWHERMMEVLALPGVVMTDVDDANNRLSVGVASESHLQAVEERLAELGIPREAVDIVQMPEVQLEVGLRDRQRPLVGGLQVSFLRNGSQFLCTEGFNAVRAGFPGYVVNSHCTATQGGVEATVHHQPAIAGVLNRVGVETVDSAYFTGGLCPAGRRCRRSDSAFIVRDAEVSASLGRIARPLTLGSVAWNPLDTFRIVREANPLVGETVTKVGRSTGRTQGVVAAVCANFNVGGTDLTQLCQSRASYASAGGDSGSPVFRIVNAPQVNDVALGGIHWGSGGIFSPISSIQLAGELGGPVTNCAPGFPC